MSAPVLIGAVYVTAGLSGKIHVANERAHKTFCGLSLPSEGCNLAMSPSTLPLDRICRRCAGGVWGLLEDMSPA
jgi:hypothetical protein